MNPKFVLSLRLFAIGVAGLLFTYLSAQAGGSNSYAPENVGIYNQSTVTSLSTVSAKAANANPNRDYLYIQNQGVNSVSVKFGSQQTASEGVIIPAAGSYQPNPPLQDSIWSKSSGGSTTLFIIEGIK